MKKATSTFKETLCFRYRGMRIEYIEKCIKSIRKNIAVNECIEVIATVLVRFSLRFYIRSFNTL